MKRFMLSLIGFVALALCVAAGSARAQVVNGTIVGTVTDTSGAVVPQAQVTVTNVGTSVNRVLTTNSRGVSENC